MQLSSLFRKGAFVVFNMLVCICTLISWQQERDEHTVFVEEAAKKSEHLKRENDRLRNLSADLSQQVWCKCYLFSFHDLCYVVSPFSVFLIYCKWELSGQNPTKSATWPDKLKENLWQFGGNSMNWPAGIPCWHSSVLETYLEPCIYLL